MAARVYVTQVGPDEFIVHCPEAGIEREGFVSKPTKAYAKGQQIVLQHLRRVLREVEEQELQE